MVLKKARTAISIHAPAKGATNYNGTDRYSIQHFNPRSREGSDGICRELNGSFLIFQSTLPRRERHDLRKSYVVQNVNFNPRSREGSDMPRKGEYKYNVDISIHAPAKGATLNIISMQSKHKYFNPRSREGSDLVDMF